MSTNSANRAAESEDAPPAPSKKRGLSMCRDCGQPFPAHITPDGIQPIGSKDCPGCGGTNLRELTNDELAH